ncbi:hypothetical protein [Nocardia sp. NBC_00511]|uniref:hypothetical protein n=1 Tax=Nocardia sp. NBC_00511 TaxID=2903591 RepID=UPI0030E5B2F3
MPLLRCADRRPALLPDLWSAVRVSIGSWKDAVDARAGCRLERFGGAAAKS